MLLRFIVAVAVVLLIQGALAQETITAPNAPPAAQANESMDTDAVQDRLELLELKLAEQDRLWLYFMAVFAIFVAVFGVAPIGHQIWTARQDRPLKDLVTDLFVQGERTRQGQSGDIHGHVMNNLRDSANTIRLVNDTLMLAKDASNRASKSIERRATIEMERLDSAAIELLMKPGSGNERALIENPQNISELESLAERISAFDIYRVVLDESVNVTPACIFIKGMHAHIRQHFSDALRCWQSVASNPNAESAMRSSAWYWIGYESNNLGQFESAKASFEQALTFATGSRLFELKRIAIESEFFDKQHGNALNARTKIDDLLTQATGELAPPERLDAIRTTAGNIWYVSGAEMLEQSDNQGHARDAFKYARSLFSSVSRRNKWSTLGEAQCAVQLKEGLEEARTEFFPRVWREAEDEYRRRKEPRTKALARFAQLICVLADPTKSGDVSVTMKQVSEEVGDVDNRMTVYSLLQRRNVSQTEMMSDIEAMVARGNGV